MHVLFSDSESGRIQSLHTLESNARAFMLCTTLWHNVQLMSEFGCDAFVRIHDPAEFGMRVAAHVRGFLSGLEGPCMYHYGRLVEFAGLPPSEEIEGSRAKSADFAGIAHYPLFLKHTSFSHQAEYRLIWSTKMNITQDYIDLKVPEARELCSREGEFGFDESFFQKPTQITR